MTEKPIKGFGVGSLVGDPTASVPAVTSPAVDGGTLRPVENGGGLSNVLHHGAVVADETIPIEGLDWVNPAALEGSTGPAE